MRWPSWAWKPTTTTWATTEPSDGCAAACIIHRMDGAKMRRTSGGGSTQAEPVTDHSRALGARTERGGAAAARLAMTVPVPWSDRGASFEIHT